MAIPRVTVRPPDEISRDCQQVGPNYSCLPAEAATYVTKYENSRMSHRSKTDWINKSVLWCQNNNQCNVLVIAHTTAARHLSVGIIQLQFQIFQKKTSPGSYWSCAAMSIKTFTWFAGSQPIIYWSCLFVFLKSYADTQFSVYSSSILCKL